MSEQGKEVLDGDKKEDWMNAKWRPMMGWMYMLVCTCDFVIFPVLWSIFHAIIHSGNVTQWQPLTLQGAGLFHMAMGAIIGVAAFGRTQEKLAGANIGGASTPNFGAPNSPSFGTSSAPSFSSPSPSFNSQPSAPSFSSPSPTPTPAFGGTPAVSKFGKVVPTQDDPPL